MTYKPILGVTIGDPQGIGPEIAVKALTQPSVHQWSRPYVFGHRTVVADALRRFRPEVTLARCDGSEPPRETTVDRLLLVEPDTPYPGPIGRFGHVTAAGGAAAFSYIQQAARWALSEKIDGIVTAPINKEALHKAGHVFAGHTEILTALTRSDGGIMMLVCGPMRVAHVTTHVSLDEVPRRITRARVQRVIAVFHQSLRQLGIDAPRIGVAGLNPHAGEGGLFGEEEKTAIAPAIAGARAEGYDVDGPVPGDTVFLALRAGRYDGVVAMYHDQGHIPVKLMGFDVDARTGAATSVRGVNVTLGLPIIRTSVDHGTAFDIAGRGEASDASMVDALHAAAVMARNKVKECR